MTSLSGVPRLVNVRSLVLNDNQLREVRALDFAQLINLRQLFLSGNPITSPFQDSSSAPASIFLDTLDLSRVSLPSFDSGKIGGIERLSKLNLSYCGVKSIMGRGFQDLPGLQTLDLTSNAVNLFTPELFKDLADLRVISTDNALLCCQGVLPASFDASRCFAPPLVLSTCENLLGERFQQIITPILALLATATNSARLAHRLLSLRGSSRCLTTLQLLTTHLATSDLLMGLHMIILAGADLAFRGSYSLKDNAWRLGDVCTLSGALADVSQVVSTLLLSLMAVVVLLSVYSQQQVSAPVLPRGKCLTAVLVSAWLLGIATAVLDVGLRMMSEERALHVATAMCRPMLLQLENGKEWMLALGVYIVPGLLCGLVMTAGAVLVSLKATDVIERVVNKPDLTTAQHSNDYQMIFLLALNGLCRLVVAVTALASSVDSTLGRRVATTVSLLVVPLPSAVDPGLLWLSVVQRRMQAKQEERLRKMTKSIEQAQIARLEREAHKIKT
jgi:hypothetical protein